MGKLTTSRFLKHSIDEQNQLVDNFKKLFYELFSKDVICEQLNINDNLYKFIKSTYNLKLSKEDVLKKRKQTCLEKYGCDNVAKSNVVKEKMQQTCLEKYGTTTVFASNIIRDKSKQSKLRRYGNEHYNNSSQISETLQQKDSSYWDKINSQRKQTKLKKYGDKNYYNYEKCKNTWNQKTSAELKDIIKKRIDTTQTKYGVDYYNNSDQIKKTWHKKSKEELNIIINKRKETCLNKFEVDSFSKTAQFKNIIKTINSNPEVKLTRSINESNSWKNKSNEDKISIQEKIKQTNMDRYGVPFYVMTKDCRESNGCVISQANKRFANLLINNDINFEQEFVVGLKSFDFKINDILVEINPTYTHNSTKGTHFGKIESEPTPTNYHLNKSQVAENAGFRCIHIWDWDNIDKIINLFLPKTIIYARNCEIREVEKDEVNNFLNLYHLQDTCKGQKYCFGLYYQNQLIELMTFGKPRYNKKYEYELLRLCSHKDYKIVGGSERLFKHFLNLYDPKSIISYCDVSKFSGDVYERLGMELFSISGPACIWSKGKVKITDNLLRQQGFDRLFNTNYGKGTSNRELILNEGFLEVYDCGQKSFRYINNLI